MASQYWTRGANGVQGPYDSLQIRGLVATGQLTPTMELSPDGTTWQAAGKVRGLFPAPEPKPILDFAPPDAGTSPPAQPAAAQPVTSLAPSNTPVAQPPPVTHAAQAQPQPSDIDALPVSDRWKQRFKKIAANPQSRQFNWLAGLFGVFYYAAKGLWKKGIAYLIVILILDEIIDVLGAALHQSVPLAAYAAPSIALYGLLANYDFYRKVVFGERFWPKLGVAGHPAVLVSALLVTVLVTAFFDLKREEANIQCDDDDIVDVVRKLEVKRVLPSSGDKAQDDRAAVAFLQQAPIAVVSIHTLGRDDRDRVVCTAELTLPPSKSSWPSQVALIPSHVRYWASIDADGDRYVEISTAGN